MTGLRRIIWNMSSNLPPDRSRKPRWIKALVLGACLGLIVWLSWYSYHGGARHPLLLALLPLALLSALANTGFIELPAGTHVPFLNVWPSLSDFAKAAVSFGLIFVWSPVAVRLVPDTNLGVAVVVGPDVLFVFFALLFLSNGLSKTAKPPYL